MGATQATLDRLRARFKKLGREGIALEERCAKQAQELTIEGVLSEWQTLQNKFRVLRDEAQANGFPLDFKEAIDDIQLKIDHLKSWEGE